MVWGDPCTEVSGTAKVGTDEQELHKRLLMPDKVAHLTNVQNALGGFRGERISSRCSSDPPKDIYLTEGGLRQPEV